jgi:hypothetical protein
MKRKLHQIKLEIAMAEETKFEDESSVETAAKKKIVDEGLI